MRPVLEDVADYVIVGTGAGGATAARLLAAAGKELVLLEEGPAFPPGGRPRALVDAMAATFRDFGATVTAGSRPFPLLQGRLVGGSTAINSGIIWRMPEDVRREWAEDHGLGALVEEQGLAAAFEVIERELDIAETSEELRGGNGRLMAEAAAKLGLPGKPIVRNARGCKGAAQCLQGCPNLARQSMDVSYIPRAMKDGARLHALCRATRILFRGGRAVGVEGDRLDAATRRRVGSFVVKARLGVIAAGGAVQTPALLRRSGVKGNVGERFRAHPGAAVLGRFPEPVGMGTGATQSYEVPLRERRMKLEVLGLPPEMLATRLPGAGAEWQERLGCLDRYAQWAVLNRMEAVGRVRPTLGGGATVRYEPTRADLERTREGVLLIARMMLAVGATEVFPGMAGRPEVIRSEAELAALERGEVRQGDFHLMASHIFGGATAGADPTKSVVGPDLAVHGLSGLWAMDASVFPTNLGVNPQHSIMAVVHRAASRLAGRESHAAVA